MKIAIVTIESINFGNRLQNYAMQKLLQSVGFDVETLQRKDEFTEDKKFKIFVKKYLQTIFQTKGAKFNSFDALINKSRYSATANSNPENLSLEYDYFVAGSDQVWNPHYDFVGMVDFLTFARDEQKISYAASFGVSELPINCQASYAKYLNNFPLISVREKTAVEIVKTLTGRDVPVVLDPTLMIDADEWRKLEKKPPHTPKGQYALIYSLGKEKSEAFQRAIKQCEDNKQLNVVDVLRKKKNGKEWEIGPSEFLNLIDHAAVVLTDSFHGTVFSILFHTPVCVFNRTGLNMSDRIDTLLKITGLEKCKEGMPMENEILNMDFEYADSQIELQREKSLLFLKQALHIDEHE